LERVRREGKRIRVAHVELRVAASPLSRARVGFIVAKHGRNSVERNRLKRRLRELVRLRLPQLPVSDIVVRTLPGAYALAWVDLAHDVDILLGRVPGIGSGSA
jgi:ribonuclease P protein component